MQISPSIPVNLSSYSYINSQWEDNFPTAVNVTPLWSTDPGKLYDHTNSEVADLILQTCRATFWGLQTSNPRHAFISDQVLENICQIALRSDPLTIGNLAIELSIRSIALRF